MDISTQEVELSQEADTYAKQFDTDHEAIADHYYQGAMAEREKMRAMLKRLRGHCRTWPGHHSQELKFLSEMELIGIFKDNGI